MKKYIKSLIYGGMDGLITTFAIVISSVSANLNYKIVLGLGFANLLADGFSMAFGDYISSKAENESNKIKDKEPIKNSIVTFLSFALFGLFPILIYIITNLFIIEKELKIVVITLLTILSISFLGYIKGSIAEINKLKSALELGLLGGIVAFLSYFVGNIFN